MNSCLLSSVNARFCRAIPRRDFSSLVSALEEFPDIPVLKNTTGKVLSTAVSKLPNGLIVVSENSSSSSTVSLTFPNAGSSSEHAGEAGAALANKFMAFKSGSGLSSAVILRNLENNGASPFALADRHGATIGYTAAPDKASFLLPLLATTCTYEKWDVKGALETAKIEVEESLNNIQTVLTESLYSAAYGPQSTLGRTLYTDGASAESVKFFRDRNYILNGAILSATGIPDHKSFVEEVQYAFGENKGVQDPMEIQSQSFTFLGGEARVHAPSSGYSHVAIAFPVPKGTSSALLHVLKYCISLSSSSGVSGFTANGIIGAYGFATSSNAGIMVDALCSALISVPDSVVVERAIVLAKAQARFALDGDSRSVAKAMTASVSETGSFSSCTITGAYDAITGTQISNAFKAITKTSPPAFAAVGDMSSVPYRGSIISKLA